MSERRKQIEELEYLEKEFIIGMEPLTEEQKDLLENIAAMGAQLEIHERKVRRYERVIDALRIRFVNSHSEG